MPSVLGAGGAAAAAAAALLLHDLPRLVPDRAEESSEGAREGVTGSRCADELRAVLARADGPRAAGLRVDSASIVCTNADADVGVISDAADLWLKGAAVEDVEQKRSVVAL